MWNETRREMQPVADDHQTIYMNAGASPRPQRRKLTVEALETQRLEERKNVELYRARCVTDKTDVFHMLGFYIVFEGVVFNTVSTSTKLTCETSLFPALLSLIVSVCAACSVHVKLTDYINDRNSLINSECILEKITLKRLLLEDRDDDNFEELDKKLNDKRNKKITEVERAQRIFASVVLFFVFTFSLAVIGYCIVIRCWDVEQEKFKICLVKVCWLANATVSIRNF